VIAGAATVAAPVRDASGQVVAVLSVSAPTMRMRPPRPRTLLPLVLDTAMKLSRVLGAPVAESAVRQPATAGNGGPGGASGQDAMAAAPVLASAGPHSMFR
jgi:hypothetical protein